MSKASYCQRWVFALLIGLTASLGAVEFGTPAKATPSPVTGTTTQVSVQVRGPVDTYTWSASGPAQVGFSPNGTHQSRSSTATFSKAGTYTLTVSVLGNRGDTGTSSVVVTVVPTVAALGITPASATVGTGATAQFAVTGGKDQFGNAAAITWTATGAGTVDGSGRFTGGATPGTATVTASAGGRSASASVLVDSAPVLSAPTATPAPPRTVALAVQASDDGGEPGLTYAWASSPSAGVTFSGPAQGTNAAKAMTATVPATGSYVFTVTAKDAQGLTASRSATAIVPDWPPVAAALSLTTMEDTGIALAPTASDPDSATLVWAVATAPAHGTLNGFDTATGAATYTPASDWNGTETFALSVRDATTTVPVAVTIVVTPVDDAPVASALSLTTAEDTAVAVAPSASDVDSATLAWAVATAPAHGTLSGFNPATGAATYTPAANWNGTESFALRVSDASSSVNVPVSITVQAVNDPPVAAPIILTTPEDTPITASAAASDVDSANLTWSLLTPPTHGTLGAVDPASATGTYTPAHDWNGTETFTLGVSDGIVTVPVAVTIVVTPVDDAPVASALSLSTAEDTAVALAPSASDVDSATLTWAVATPPAHGTLSGFDPATGAATYTPATDWNGTETFALSVRDATTTVPVAVTIAVAPVDDASIITGVETAPRWIRDGDAAVQVTSGLTISDGDSATLTGATVRITGNYRAAEDVLAVAAPAGIASAWDAASGSLVLSGTAPLATYQAALRAVTYRNLAAFPDTAARSIGFTVKDVAISAAAVREIDIVTRSTAPWSEGFESTPLASDLHQLERQGGTRWHGWDANPAASATVQGAIARSGGNAVAIAGSSDLVHEYKGVNSGGWRYTAWQFIPAGYSGQPYFILLNTYRDGDGSRNWSTQVSFNGASGRVHSDFDGAELPLITGRWVEIRVDIDFDHDRQRFSYDGVQLYEKSWSNGVIGSGSVNLAAVDLYANGSAAIYYDDLSLTRIPPTLANPGPAVAYVENAPATAVAPALTVGDFGIASLAGATVRITGNYQPGQDVLSGPGTWDAATGTLTLSGSMTPAAMQAALRAVAYADLSEAPSVAPRTVSFTVSDGSIDSNTVTATVGVTSVNDPPVASGVALVTDEDVAVSGQIAASDPDGTVSFRIVTGPLHGAAAVDGGGAVSYQPTADWNGNDAFTVGVSDGLAEVVVPVAVTVNPVDDPAVVSAPATLAAVAGGEVLVPGLAIADIDSPVLTITLSAGAGRISLPAVGSAGAVLVGGSGALDASVTVSGDAAAIAAVLADVVYRAPAAPGSDSIQIVGNGGTASVTVAIAAPAVVAVAPLAMTSWDAGAPGYAPTLLPPGRVWTLDVASSGTYFLWAQGSAPATALLALAVDGGPVGAIALPAGAPAWTCRDGGGAVQALSLAAGTHTLALGGLAGGATLQRLLLVAATPAGTVHDQPVMAGIGAVTVLDAADYDSGTSGSGYAWLPVAGGGVQALPDLGGGDSTGSLATGCVLSFDVYFAQPGTYRMWMRGAGDGNSDSAFVGLDGAAPPIHVSYFPTATAGWGSVNTTGGIPMLTVASAGLHHLEVRLREDGTTLYQIAIAGVSAWVPAYAALPVSARIGVAQPVAGAVVLEAEAASQLLPSQTGVYNWQVQALTGASGQGLRVSPDIGGGFGSDAAALAKAPAAVYYASFPAAGTYDVWVRAAGPDWNGDSVHIGLAGNATTSNSVNFALVGTALPLAWTHLRFDGSQAQIAVPAPGIYPVNVWMREDGAALDRLLFQPAGSPAPTGIGPAASPLTAPVQGNG